MKIKEKLPTLITLGNMVCGFVSILCILNNSFEIAAWLIVTAMALDAFDGRLARMMKSTSKTGAQLDSMADLITFGIAPALLMIKTCDTLPVIALWGIGLFFTICSAFRLARFNAQKDENTKLPGHFFTGLPTTLSGGTVAQLTILNHFIQTKLGAEVICAVLPFIVICLGIFMISKIPFFNVTNKIGIKQGLVAMTLEFSAAIVFFVISPALALSTSLSCYVIICTTYGVLKGRNIRNSYSAP